MTDYIPIREKPWVNSYYSMMKRCYSEKCNMYKRYGGRGIKVCDEWHDVHEFAKWADKTYLQGRTLDRLDNDKDYSPSNCRWATRKEQANNRSTCVMISYNGETHNITKWGELLGISRYTLNRRYHEGKRPPELFEKPEDKKGSTWFIGEDGRRKWAKSS